MSCFGISIFTKTLSINNPNFTSDTIIEGELISDQFMTELIKGNYGFPLCMPGLTPSFLLTSQDKQNSLVFFLPERFCVLLYHAPSSGDFSSAISSSSSSRTSSAGRGRERCNILTISPDFLKKLQRPDLTELNGGGSPALQIHSR